MSPLLVFFTNKEQCFSNLTIHQENSSLVKNTSDGGKQLEY